MQRSSRNRGVATRTALIPLASTLTARVPRGGRGVTHSMEFMRRRSRSICGSGSSPRVTKKRKPVRRMRAEMLIAGTAPHLPDCTLHCSSLNIFSQPKRLICPMIDQRNFAGNIAYDDLRQWLALAERLGEVRTVKGANCEEDIGLAAEAVLRAEHGPCVVFEDIPGCPKGFRLLLNMFAGTRRNMTLGFPDHLSKWELSDAYREAYLQEQRIVPHVVVDDGPVFENVMMGDDVDVTIFPAPKWHEKDGGRYIGTGTYSITRDPEENWLNAGAYRAQVHDKKTVGIVMAAGHHGRIHRDKSFKRGEPLPVVMVLGGDPIAF